FFSSRRRHTRFDCDWSSDVCSSDLLYSNTEPLQIKTAQLSREQFGADTLGSSPAWCYDSGTAGPAATPWHDQLFAADVDGDGLRSEERRVGKECRSRWAADQ